MEVIVRQSIPISADAAWSIAGAFNWLPVVSTPTASSTLAHGGSVRALVNADGSMLWEQLLEYHHSDRVLSYAIVDEKGCEAMAYGVGFIGRIQILPDGDNASIYEYRADFTPRSGVGEETAREAVERFVKDSADGVVRAFRRGTVGSL